MKYYYVKLEDCKLPSSIQSFEKCDAKELTIETFGQKIFDEILVKQLSSVKCRYNPEMFMFESDYFNIMTIDENHEVKTTTIKILFPISIKIMVCKKSDIKNTSLYTTTLAEHYDWINKSHVSMFEKHVEKYLNQDSVIKELRRPKSFIERIISIFNKPICPDQINTFSVKLRWEYWKIKKVFSKSDIRITLCMEVRTSTTKGFCRQIKLYDYMYFVKSFKSIDDVWDGFFKDGIKHLTPHLQ